MHVPAATTLLALVAAGCGAPAEAPVDAPGGVQVTGCDDPAVWTAPALEAGLLDGFVGGTACSPAQYPLHRASLTWSAVSRALSVEERARYRRACWRVIEASPGSGWSAGQTFTSDVDPAWTVTQLNLAGFGSSVTIEGRVLRDDGTLAFALPPATVTLDEARVLAPDASKVVAVMSREAWAERDAVYLRGQRIPTDEVLDGSFGGTLHRTADGLVMRWWSLGAAGVSYQDLFLGAGTRARTTWDRRIAIVDDALLMLGDPATPVRYRIPLGSEPREVVANYYYVTVHVDGALLQFRHATGEWRSLPVGDGVLVPADGDAPPKFFDGTRFRGLTTSATALAFDDAQSIAPPPEDLAVVGTPIAVLHGIVFGERGMVIAANAADPQLGPRVATYAELFGAGRLSRVAADEAAYLITRDDGSAVLYEAPLVNWCL